MVHKENETAIQTQAMCRRRYQDEIAQSDRVLLARNEHQRTHGQREVQVAQGPVQPREGQEHGAQEVIG
eukprot:12930324-Prorocentrum_lima.AAC.1